jgi:hypothetical protein
LSLQRCEGSDLESVLEEVRTRFGDTVTVVEANRLRKGGIGGFFARERFEVVVDVIDDAPTELPAEYGLEATENFADRLLSMADGVTDGDAPASHPTARVSTEQPEFAAVLDSITRHMSGPDAPAAATPAAAPAVSAGPVASAAPAPDQTGPSVSGDAIAYPNPFAGVLSSPAPVPAAPAVGPAPVSAPAPVPAVDARMLARVGLPEDIRRAAVTNPSPPAGTDPSAWLVGLLADLPVPERLPQGPGSVIVIAGSREPALLLARQITAELGLDPAGLLIASPGYKGRGIPADRRLPGVEAAAEARSSWRRRPRPTVVVVDAPLGRPGEWARRVIDALEPTVVWGAVEATRKPEDLFEWSEQLGGFDALGVTELEGTVSPAAVLQCGIPVGRLEGRPATPLLWASLLASRLCA